VTYYSQGQCEEAEQLSTEVVKRRRELLGKEHMTTLMGVNNLATMLMHQYRWKEARELERDGKGAPKNDGGEKKCGWRGKFGLMSSTGVILVPPQVPNASRTAFLHPASR
jgi:hypothetical protein